jgi:hypothetical protein
MKYTVVIDNVQRSVGEVVRTYRDQLTNFVHEALNGSMDALDMRRAHNALVRQLGPQSYIEGLREGGIPAEEMDAEDKAEIQEWVTGQLEHVNQFAADAVAARGDDGKRAGIMSRLDMWVAAMSTIGGLGLMSSKRNVMGTWHLGPTEEHCRTCPGLNKKRHRLSWYKSRGLIPREPGSTTLECHGYNCQCFVSDDEGNRLI